MKLDKEKIIRFVSDNRKYIDLGLKFSQSFMDYSINKSYFSFAKNMYQYIIDNVDFKFSSEYLSEENGWKILESEYGNINELYIDTIFKQPLKCILTSLWERGSQIEIYDISMAEIAIARNKEYYNYNTNLKIFFKTNNNNIKSKDIYLYLSEIILKKFTSNLISIKRESSDKLNVFSAKSLEFKSETNERPHSNEANFFIENLKKANAHNMCRSILFFGPPGTGKSTIIENIVRKLNYKTLFINLSDIKNYNEILFILDYFKFEAIIIDDFDLSSNSSSLLKFLEDARKHVKVVLASANNLKNIYSALKRPDRFDEIVEITKLNEMTVRSLTKDIPEVFENVKEWPVAYINELVTRTVLDGHKNNLQQNIKELNKRVLEQLEDLKK